MQVTLPDFLLGDQLTSQVQALRSVQFYICHYGWGDYKLRQNTCTDSDTYNAFLFIVAVVPYVCRLLQVPSEKNLAVCFIHIITFAEYLCSA